MEGDITEEAIGTFISANRLPSVVEFSDEVRFYFFVFTSKFELCMCRTLLVTIQNEESGDKSLAFIIFSGRIFQLNLYLSS